MGTSWDDPKWVRQGRTGPGPVAPKYAKASDRGGVLGAIAKLLKGSGKKGGKKK